MSRGWKWRTGLRGVREMLAGHAAAGVHGQRYVHRETIPLSLLREGLEKLNDCLGRLTGRDLREKIPFPLEESAIV